MAVLWTLTREPDYARVVVADTEALERELEALRVRLRIPSLSAAVARDGDILWSRGLGLADVERAVEAQPDTIYPVASLTKGYASTIVLQLAAEGRLDPETAVSRYGIAMDRSRPVRVWHLLSHTSGDPPGTSYRYDGSVRAAHRHHRAGRGTSVRVRGRGPDRAPAEPGFHRPLPEGDGFSIALDDGRLLPRELRERAWTPPVTEDGERLPYALGWFVQWSEGERLVWSYGHAFESSAILVTVPDRRLTFVALANSDGLSRGRGLGDHGDVTASPAARLFLNWVAGQPERE